MQFGRAMRARCPFLSVVYLAELWPVMISRRVLDAGRGFYQSPFMWPNSSALFVNFSPQLGEYHADSRNHVIMWAGSTRAARNSPRHLVCFCASGSAATRTFRFGAFAPALESERHIIRLTLECQSYGMACLLYPRLRRTAPASSVSWLGVIADIGPPHAHLSGRQPRKIG